MADEGAISKRFGGTQYWSNQCVARPYPPGCDVRLPDRPNEGDFETLCAAYSASGGVAQANALAGRLESRRGLYEMSLEKLVALGLVFGFPWQRMFLVPMFQFDPHNLTVRPGPRQVVGQLVTVFEGWRLATWFVQPCPCLGRRSPIDVLDTRFEDVLSAAQTERIQLVGPACASYPR